MSGVLYPSVITNVDGHDQRVDLNSYFFSKERTVYLVGEITDLVYESITTQLLYLDGIGDEDITLVINSPGGSVSAGLAIYDVMKHKIKCDIVTVGTGICASMGSFLLAAGTKGKRYGSPTADIMIHQPLGGVQGQATDISLVADHIQKVKKKLAEILAEACSKTTKRLLNDMERDNWKTSEEALEYGLIDHIGFPERV